MEVAIKMADKIEIQNLQKLLQEKGCHSMAHALESDDFEGTSSQELVEQLGNNQFVKSYMKKHSSSSDATAAIVELSSIILEAGEPENIGRQLVRVAETTASSMKIRLPKRGKAVSSARSKRSTSFGERNSYITITPDQFIEASEEWDDTFIEDAEWDESARQAAAIGSAHDEEETVKIIAALEAIPNSVIASSATYSAETPNTFAWNDIVNMWNLVKNEKGTPNVLALHTDQLADLFKDADFKDKTLLGEFLDVEKGMFGKTILGVQVIASTLMTPGTAFMLDTEKTMVYTLRRNKLFKTYTDDKEDKFGVKVSSRYSLDEGRPEFMARTVNA